MKSLKSKICALTLGAMTLMSVPIFAEMPGFTAVIGDKAFDLEYINNPKNIKEIQPLILENSDSIYVKMLNGKWINNLTGKEIAKDALPQVNYKDKNGNTTVYEAKDGDIVKNEDNGQASSLSEFQKKVVELVNVERAKVGAKPLTANVELSKVATIKSQDMIDKNYFDHNSPTYGSPSNMIKQFGINYSAVGENIAYGQRTPEDVMNSWMNSEGHKRNILNPNFEEIGVGIAKNSNGTIYWTQMFIK